jgi:hypothetical protein
VNMLLFFLSFGRIGRSAQILTGEKHAPVYPTERFLGMPIQPCIFEERERAPREGIRAELRFDLVAVVYEDGAPGAGNYKSGGMSVIEWLGRAAVNLT